MQRLLDRQPLVRAEHAAAAALAVHGDRDQPHDVRRHDRRVVVHCEGHASVDRPARRADVGAPLLAEAAHVPVAPEERVRREERRHDSQPRRTVELVGAHQLRVDDHRPVVGHLVRALEPLFDPVHHEVHRRVTVAVHQERHAPLDQRLHAVLVVVRVHDAVRPVVRRRARRSLVVRLRDPRGAALRRAVEQELDASDAYAVPVGRLVLVHLGILRRVKHAEHGHVRLQRLTIRGRPKRLHERPEGATVLDRRDAVAEVHVDRPSKCPVDVTGTPLRVCTPVAEEPARRLLQDAVRLPRALDPADVAAVGVGRVGRDAAVRERERVRRRQVARHVGQHDRVLGRDPVEIEPCRMPTLLQQRVVVAATGYHLARRNVLLVDPRPGLLYDVVDVLDVPYRRGVERQYVQCRAHVQDVAVGVDEAGQQRVRAEIHHPGAVAPERHHVGQGSGRRDRLAEHGHRFDRRPIRIHRDDVIAKKNRIRGRRLAAIRAESHQECEADSGY